MPHGHCYLWQPHILWTNVLSDFVIAASYFSIPVAILIFSHKRPDIGNSRVLFLFSAFILLCGITHLFGIYTVWQGVYGAHGLAKLATAVVSFITAVYVFRILPNAIMLPSPSQYEGIKRELDEASLNRAKLMAKIEEQDLANFMLDSLPISAAIVGKENKFLVSTKFFLEEFGYTKDALLEKNMFDIFASEVTGSANSELESQTQFKKQILVQVKCGNGDIIPTEMTMVRERYNDTPTTIITLKNLTEYRQIKRELLESHRQLERAINATDDGIWEWHIKDNSMFWSPSFAKMIGFNISEQPSIEKWKSHIHPDYKDIIAEALDTHFRTGEKLSVEYLGRNKLGEYGWFNVIGNSIMNEKHEPITMSGSLRYIQESKLLKQKVAEKTEFLNTIYEGANHAIWVIDVIHDQPDPTLLYDFVFTEFNQTAASRMDVPVKNIIGKPLFELAGSYLPSELVKHLHNNYSKCVEQNAAINYQETIPLRGKPCWYQTSLYPIYNSAGKVQKIVGTAIDITEQKKGEEALESYQKFLLKMINSTVCGLYLYDIASPKYIQINKRFTDILGYTFDDLSHSKQLTSHIHPDDQSKVTEHINNVKEAEEGALIAIEYRAKHKSGKWVWCKSIDSSIRHFDPEYGAVMLGTFVDITENVMLLAQLKQSNEYLERFAFVASHDLQEPLRKITAFSDSLSTRLAPVIDNDEDAKFELSRLQGAATRMRTMIQDILRLSRIYTTDVQIYPIKLNRIIERACDQLEYLIEDTNTVVNVKSPDVELYVDESLMIQLFQNLISNSIKFCPEERTPHIDISAELTTAEAILHHKDNGIGIDSKFIQQIFDPFYRLHSAKNLAGTGIGLTICRQITKAHDGDIRCQQPVEGIGAEFVITLPQPGEKDD
ncbi:PAS domain S-box protein [Aestuariibacter sp. AA17]|uniref:histidine kinase n=1 Tax=Fluctibacter corallii TaxID=2984329 RepID=A0ABT3AA53_9ALTE|nr:PAS domain S-box protein [Aestuariibacter sp. AA17]MCV2885157.1 PAS domain S-box protein [Aestuariibacter sp. AA17]